MIKSINYQANQIASIEISDASDVQSLGDSYGYGSTARVTGQIGDEYIYTPQGWIKISSGGGGSEVIANPEMEGNEDSLTGIQIGDTKYAVGGGGGGGGGVLVVNTVSDSTTQTVTLKKTWQEIHDADLSVVVSKASDYAQTYLVTEVKAPPSPSGAYTVRTRGSRNGLATSDLWQAASPDDYPVLAST